MRLVIVAFRGKVLHFRVRYDACSQRRTPEILLLVVENPDGSATTSLVTKGELGTRNSLIVKRFGGLDTTTSWAFAFVESTHCSRFDGLLGMTRRLACALLSRGRVGERVPATSYLMAGLTVYFVTACSPGSITNH